MGKAVRVEEGWIVIVPSEAKKILANMLVYGNTIATVRVLANGEVHVMVDEPQNNFDLDLDIYEYHKMCVNAGKECETCDVVGCDLEYISEEG
jgi:hypothetical protein